MGKPLISGELKKKLDDAMAKAVVLVNPNKIKEVPPSIQWRMLHLAMTSPKCAEQNSGFPNKKIMDEVYKVGNDTHLFTYLKNYFKVSA